MGINISYQGSLSDLSRLDELLREVRAFCRRAGWRCQKFSEHYSGVVLLTPDDIEGKRRRQKPDPEPWPEWTKDAPFKIRVSKVNPPDLIDETVRGIIVHPRGTESLVLIFDHTGRLVEYMEVPRALVVNAIPDTNHYMATGHFVKTSGATDSHVAICVLLRMLKERFMPNLEVSDPTGFWKNWNAKTLERHHGEMSALLGAFRESSDLAGILRKLGVDLQAGKIRLLDPNLDEPVAAKKKPKPKVH